MTKESNEENQKQEEQEVPKVREAEHPREMCPRAQATRRPLRAASGGPTRDLLEEQPPTRGRPA